MPKKKINLKKVNDAIDDMTSNIDGWGNILTGLGIEDRDKRMSAFASRSFFTTERLEDLYQCDDIAAKIVDLMPREMLRQGYTLKIEGDEDGSLAKATIDSLEKLQTNQKIEEQFRLARLYGGAAMLKGFIGNGAKLAPSSVKFLTVLDSTMLQADSTTIISDLRDPNFGLPEFYKIVDSTADQTNKKIHRSRLIIVNGVDLPRKLLAKNDYWGQSVLLRTYNALRNFNTGYDSMATILTDFTQAIFKIKDLNKILKRGNEGESIIRTRLRLITLLKSIVNAIVIQDNEEYTKTTTNVGGLADLLKKLDNRIVAATDIPHTILLGESPSGLGATGNSEKTDWYDKVKSEQMTKLDPVLRQVIDIVLFQINGGVIPPYTIQYNALWQLDDKEQAEVQKSVAEADAIYLDRGALSVDEVRQSRWPSGKFSLDTHIDLDTDLTPEPIEIDNDEE